jgi:hypothetical protein
MNPRCAYAVRLGTRLGLRAAIASGALSLAGCAHMETMMTRKGDPDNRIELPTDRAQVLLSAREIPDHTCAANYLLQCEGSGGVSSSCRCASR